MSYTVPDGYVYYQASTTRSYQAGATITFSPATGDRLYPPNKATEKLDYRYNVILKSYTYNTSSGGRVFENDTTLNGWSCCNSTYGRTETTYSNIIEPFTSINGRNVRSMRFCFADTRQAKKVKVPMYVFDITGICGYSRVQQITFASTANVKIADAAFRGCSSTYTTTTPSLPSSVESMQRTFQGTNFNPMPTIPSSAKDISYCFYETTVATTPASIPSGVQEMDYCFSKSAITSLPTIPSSVTSMEHCFQSCTSLPATITSITINNNYTVDTYGLFQDCTSIVEFTNLPSVYNYDYMFAGCTNLTTVGTMQSFVKTARHCFDDTNLQGIITIDANTATGCGPDFYDTTETIILRGSSTKLASYAQNCNNNNVFVEGGFPIPVIRSFTMQRAEANGQKSFTGTYALVSVSAYYIQADDYNYIQEPTLILNGTSAVQGITWYSDQARTTPIDFTNYEPSSSFSMYALIGTYSADTNYHFSLTIDDAFESSLEASVTLYTSYLTMDIQEGGKEIAFGATANDALTNYPNGLFKCEMAIKGSGFLDYIYPIGSPFLNVTGTLTPATLFGGTWTKLGTQTIAGASFTVWRRTA